MSRSLGTYHVSYLGEDLGETEMFLEDDEAPAPQVNCGMADGGGYRRTAQIIIRGAGCGVNLDRMLFLGPIKPAKHWVRDRDWTQRQARRPKRRH